VPASVDTKNSAIKSPINTNGIHFSTSFFAEIKLFYSNEDMEGISTVLVCKQLDLFAEKMDVPLNVRI
jgi:hypothetical protein